MSKNMTTKKAAALLESDRQRREQAAAAAVAAVLKEHGCDLVAVPVIAPDGRIAAQVQVVAL
jgi:pyruvate/2-oxoglutarate dehydrogenase complex dihydrolipoamide acyltransferase (E2) component